MTPIRTACMGGMCLWRERCGHYHAEGRARLSPAERLCSTGSSEQFVDIEGDRPWLNFKPETERHLVRVFGAAAA